MKEMKETVQQEVRGKRDRMREKHLDETLRGSERELM